MLKEVKFKDKKEFIQALMDGRTFNVGENTVLVHYDSTKSNPFRYGDAVLDGVWDYYSNLQEVLPDPIKEKQWQMYKPGIGISKCTPNYYSQERLNKDFKASDGWIKLNMIEVTL